MSFSQAQLKQIIKEEIQKAIKEEKQMNELFGGLFGGGGMKKDQIKNAVVTEFEPLVKANKIKSATTNPDTMLSYTDKNSDNVLDIVFNPKGVKISTKGDTLGNYSKEFSFGDKDIQKYLVDRMKAFRTASIPNDTYDPTSSYRPSPKVAQKPGWAPEAEIEKNRALQQRSWSAANRGYGTKL